MSVRLDLFEPRQIGRTGDVNRQQLAAFERVGDGVDSHPVAGGSYALHVAQQNVMRSEPLADFLPKHRARRRNGRIVRRSFSRERVLSSRGGCEQQEQHGN